MSIHLSVSLNSIEAAAKKSEETATQKDEIIK
jgi:hypothetical protein